MNYWQHAKPVRRARAVDVATIAKESAALLDAGGPPALTVRALARRIGVAPASLYSRVDSADDLRDLALDHALSSDPQVQAGVAGSGIEDVMLTFYRHLIRHPWTAAVIASRAPRGPGYLRLSERMCVLLAARGAADPLALAYTLSNFVIGSAMTASIVHDERVAPVDADLAPLYASLHQGLNVDQDPDDEVLVRSGLAALISSAVTGRAAPPVAGASPLPGGSPSRPSR